MRYFEIFDFEGLKIAGAKQIIAVDILDDKLELAKKWGATDTINSKNLDKPVQAKVLKFELGHTVSCWSFVKVEFVLHSGATKV